MLLSLFRFVWFVSVNLDPHLKLKILQFSVKKMQIYVRKKNKILFKPQSLPRSAKYEILFMSLLFYGSLLLSCSVRDPSNFGADPDPDTRIRMYL